MNIKNIQINRKEIHPALEASVISMILSENNSDNNLRFFGEFCLFLNYKESLNIPTCSVYCQNTHLNIVYNKEFVEKLSQSELNFVQVHEVLHLLCDHINRSKQKGYDSNLYNIAMDMIINSMIISW